MPDVSRVVEEAMAQLGSTFPGDKSTREEIVGSPDDRMDFGNMDDRFYDLADTEKFFQKLPKFVPFADAYAATD